MQSPAGVRCQSDAPLDDKCVLHAQTSYGAGNATRSSTESHAHGDRIAWLRFLPFVGMHLACIACFFVEWSLVALAVSLVLYLLRMFAITAFYHRYFSHRSFKTHRFTQFLFAMAGSTAMQRGALWWASHHRHHHRHADTPNDLHSPRHRGVLWSHIVWFWTYRSLATDLNVVRDFGRYPELRLLNRYHLVPPLCLAAAIYALGVLLDQSYPQLHTSGWQLLICGFLVSTILVYHATYTINSLAHRIGSRRFATHDDSRNNILLAVITLGEGWHNNHHYCPTAARQGFYWWEIDLTYYVLKVMEYVGLIWDLHAVPSRALKDGERN